MEKKTNFSVGGRLADKNPLFTKFFARLAANFLSDYRRFLQNLPVFSATAPFILMFAKRRKRCLRFNHMIAILKSDCLVISQESDIIGCHNNTFSLLSINAAARTIQERVMLRRLYVFQGYNLQAG